jgi:chromosome partitioning protein
MFIYAILSLKGGVAKTTSAVHLATCAAAAGKRVVVIDADEERSAVRWASFITDEMPFEIVAGERDRLAQQARAFAQEGRVVIIDTPPNNREILTRAGMLATNVVVPVVPTGLDVDRMKPTLELLRDVEATKGELDVAIMFTRWDGRTLLAREAEEALKDFPVLESKIRQLTRYAQAFGTVPGYLQEYDSVWKEISHGN